MLARPLGQRLEHILDALGHRGDGLQLGVVLPHGELQFQQLHLVHLAGGTDLVHLGLQGLAVPAQSVGGILEQLADIDPARASYIHGVLLTDPQCGHLALTLLPPGSADVDMVLAFGTWAGQDLAAQDLPVPVIVSSVTNAVDAGIIPSVEDSGRDNLVAPIEPDRFKRQVLLFHDIFAFKKLGIAYEDTPAGRSSIALNEIEDAARELGVTLLRCTDTFDIQDTDLASERLLACHKKLVEQGAEAVYLTYNVGLQASAMRNVLQPLADAHIPTFSQLGVPDVVHGALLSVAQSNAAEEGRFSAGLVEAILKGARPRDLSPVFESPVSMALNLFMATLIGWNPPLEVLAAVDEFYQEMK